MMIKKILLATLFFSSCISKGQEELPFDPIIDDPEKPSEQDGHDDYLFMSQDMIAVHNIYRKDVGVPNLTWDHKLAAQADDWAKVLVTRGCALQHSRIWGVGENIYWAKGRYPNAIKVTDAWANERFDYDYKTNTCATGKVCGHYTQMIWSTTERVGCAERRCEDKNEVVWVCQYAPTGNWIGQKPY